MSGVWAVCVDFIDALNEAARSTYPDEFICLHRAHNGIIDEFVMLPGSVFGETHSFINYWMDPIDYERTGSAHSHPGYSAEASEDDLQVFRSTGGVHFITCLPYDRTSWRVYNSAGERISLDLVYEDGTKVEPEE
ncbi:MAG: hypothetical protein E7Z63_01875 [Thermoplasmata archaeon]|nr:hypothetical protein [Thermoplasmata archaeon]